jgi:hypothetical protein
VQETNDTDTVCVYDTDTVCVYDSDTVCVYVTDTVYMLLIMFVCMLLIMFNDYSYSCLCHIYFTSEIKNGESCGFSHNVSMFCGFYLRPSVFYYAVTQDRLYTSVLICYETSKVTLSANFTYIYLITFT